MSRARKVRATPEVLEDWERILREMYPVGSTMRGIVTDVSRDGMNRSITFVGVRDGRPVNVSRMIAGLLDYSANEGGVRVSGCGMDMIFATVYDLARKLHGDGYAISSSPL